MRLRLDRAKQLRRNRSLTLLESPLTAVLPATRMFLTPFACALALQQANFDAIYRNFLISAIFMEASIQDKGLVLGDDTK
jgi:hypothetical protein